VSKVSNPNYGGAIPPKPPAKDLPKQPTKTEPKLEILSLSPPSRDPKLDRESLDLAEALSPIPIPSATLQYRAIGVIFGEYIPSAEHFCKGKLKTFDGIIINAVVLGRVMPIIQKKLAPQKSYLWVVYPRTIERTSELYLQISGVWAPKETGKTDFDLDANIEDGYFSIRGEVLEQSISRNYVVVKIKRSERQKKLPRSQTKFKLKLKGILPNSGIGYFWDITVQRKAHSLIIISAKAIAAMPKKAPMKPVPKFDPSNQTLTNHPMAPVKRPRI